MKLCVRKVYCPKCQKLVTCQEQKSNDSNRFVCGKCGGLIWSQTGTRWKYATKFSQ